MNKFKKIINNNEPISALIHFIGFLFSIAALVILVVFASIKGTTWHIVSFSIFGGSLILLYLASTLYHFISKNHSLKITFRKVDHAMIYILIAGTYTPICLVLLRGGWGWSIFGIIWFLAGTGIAIKIKNIKMKSWLSPLLYISMGWIILIARVPLLEVISFKGMFWLIMGGVLYTSGTLFFALDKFIPKIKWITTHDVFHIFVIGGSASHFWFMYKVVLG